MHVQKLKYIKILVALTLCCLFLTAVSCTTDKGKYSDNGTTDTLEYAAEEPRVSPGAEVLLEEKLDILKGRKIAILANQTTVVYDNTHLVDTLVALGLDIKKVFVPEHGFRGDVDAGAKVDDETDVKTGLPIVSLYGKNKKPSQAMLKDVDLVLFDVQDVGARFYTYISTMTYMMEACAEAGIQMIVLDRPNPNGWYVDGPVLEDQFKSFIGMHNVPIAHGMTLGEYAVMVNGEKWMDGGPAKLDVIKCRDYNHSMKWENTGLEWISPSPNLSDPYAAYLYPAICWFEGTAVSVGRGTDSSFMMLGAPWHKGYETAWKKDSIDEEPPSKMQQFGLEMEVIRFTPRSLPGKSMSPKFQGETCFGVRFTGRVSGEDLFKAGLAVLANFYTESQNVGKRNFFLNNFNLLAGNASLQEQIKAGTPALEIWQGWQPDVNNFKKIRSKYLLYPDAD